MKDRLQTSPEKNTASSSLSTAGMFRSNGTSTTSDSPISHIFFPTVVLTKERGSLGNVFVEEEGKNLPVYNFLLDGDKNSGQKEFRVIMEGNTEQKKQLESLFKYSEEVTAESLVTCRSYTCPKAKYRMWHPDLEAYYSTAAAILLMGDKLEFLDAILEKYWHGGIYECYAIQYSKVYDHSLSKEIFNVHLVPYSDSALSEARQSAKRMQQSTDNISLECLQKTRSIGTALFDSIGGVILSPTPSSTPIIDGCRMM